MEIIIFVGAQAAGKSSFYKNRFFHTHMRVNLDMLKTRNRERILFEACLSARQPVVIDNTNPTRADRARYIRIGMSRDRIRDEFSVVGYYFQSIANDCLERNLKRERDRRVPNVAIRGTIDLLELPRFEEGFRELNFVRIEDQGFVVEEWKNDI